MVRRAARVLGQAHNLKLAAISSHEPVACAHVHLPPEDAVVADGRALLAEQRHLAAR